MTIAILPRIDSRVKMVCAHAMWLAAITRKCSLVVFDFIHLFSWKKERKKERKNKCKKSMKYFSFFFFFPFLKRQVLRGPAGTYCDPGTFPSPTTYGQCQSGLNCVSTETYGPFYGLYAYFCDCALSTQVRTTNTKKKHIKEISFICFFFFFPTNFILIK